VRVRAGRGHKARRSTLPGSSAWVRGGHASWCVRGGRPLPFDSFRYPL